MEKKGFQLYYDYRGMCDALTDEQAGQLLKAIFAHEAGEQPELDGALKGIYILLANQLDRDSEKYIKKCDKNKENAQKRWVDNTNVCERIPPHANVCETVPKHADTDTDTDTDTDIKTQGAHTRTGDVFSGRSFSPKMQDKITEWLKYKTEKRDTYKPTGLTAFLSQVENQLKKHTEDDVCALIDECMAANWKGIIWDKIKSRASPRKEYERPVQTYDHLVYDPFAEIN